MEPTSDLVRKWLDDPDEYRKLVAMARRALMRYGRWGDRDASAEDIAHEAVLHVLRIPHPADIRNPGAFIRTTIRHLVIDLTRRPILRNRVEAYDREGDGQILTTEPAADGPSPEEALITRIDRTQLLAAVSQLPHNSQQVIGLRLQELDIAQIAGVLGIKEVAARVRLFRAMKELKELYRRQRSSGSVA